MLGMQTLDDQFRDPIEETREAQIRDDQHHRKQQHDGREVDRRQRLARAHDAECHHEYGADDRRTGTIDLQARKLPESKNDVAAEEDQISGKDACVGQKGCQQCD